MVLVCLGKLFRCCFWVMCFAPSFLCNECTWMHHIGAYKGHVNRPCCKHVGAVSWPILGEFPIRGKVGSFFLFQSMSLQIPSEYAKTANNWEAAYSDCFSCTLAHDWHVQRHFASIFRQYWTNWVCSNPTKCSLDWDMLLVTFGFSTNNSGPEWFIHSGTWAKVQ